MLPFEVPAGTSLDDFFLSLLPVAFPPLAAGATTPFRGRCAARIVGHGVFTMDLDGPRLRSAVGAPSSIGGPGETLASSQSLADCLALLTAAIAGGKAKGPPPRPPDGAFAGRIASLKGVVRVLIPDLENPEAPGGRGCQLDIALAPPGKALEMVEDAQHDGADVTITLPYALLRTLADGGDPVALMKGSAVRVEGKRHLAVALAAALLPLVPPPAR